MSEKSKKAAKSGYFNKLISLCQEYNKIVIVNADNVGSRQMMDIRKQLRGKGVVLMGKNVSSKKGDYEESIGGGGGGGEGKIRKKSQKKNIFFSSKNSISNENLTK